MIVLDSVSFFLDGWKLSMVYIYSYLSSFLHHVMPSNLKPELPPTDARTGNQVDGLREIGQSKIAPPAMNRSSMRFPTLNGLFFRPVSSRSHTDYVVLHL